MEGWFSSNAIKKEMKSLILSSKRTPHNEGLLPLLTGPAKVNEYQCLGSLSHAHMLIEREQIFKITLSTICAAISLSLSQVTASIFTSIVTVSGAKTMRPTRQTVSYL